MMGRADVLVIGGGILGLLTAADLASRGQRVVIVRGETEPASDASLVWLNVISTETADYARLRIASMRVWHSIVAADPACPVTINGSLLWDRDRQGLEELSGFQNGLGWETQVIDQPAFSDRAPGIGPVPESALWAPGEAAADPDAMLSWASARVAGEGVAVLDGSVAEIIETGGKASGVRLADGSTVFAQNIVVAAGVGSAPLLAPFAFDPGLRMAPGMLLVTTPMARISTAVMASPLMDFWQADDGRVFIATGTHQTMVDDLEATAKAALANLAVLVPGSPAPGIAQIRMRDRPIPGDGYPLIGPVPGVSGLWLALSHSGMTLAPVIAGSICDMVLGVDMKHDIGPFAPDRMTRG